MSQARARLQAAARQRGSLTFTYQPSLDTEAGCDLCSGPDCDLGHYLVPRCPQLRDRREALVQYWRSVTRHHAAVSGILDTILETGDEEDLLQLVLRPDTVAGVAEAAAEDATVLPLVTKITNVWCYSMFRARLKMQGRWIA